MSLSRLKLEAQEEAQQVKSLHLELQRKEDDSSDLREKLADYRKQVQQVQKEVRIRTLEDTGSTHPHSQLGFKQG